MLPSELASSKTKPQWARFNRTDILQAHYLFYRDFFETEEWSLEYYRMHVLEMRFGFNRYNLFYCYLSNNAKKIHDNLVNKQIEKILGV